MTHQEDPRRHRRLSKWIGRHETLPPPPGAEHPRRYAVYIRKSTDERHESSVERQLAAATAYAKRTGLVPTSAHAEFTDIGRSGYTMLHRPGLDELLQAVRRQLLEVIVVEDVDRLSRHLGDASWIWRLCRHHGVEIHTPTLGRLDSATVAMHGLRGDEDRRRLLSITSQGRWQAAKRGGLLRMAACYGYRKTDDVEHPLAIDPDAAIVVRRIFEEYAAGRTANAIATDLNRDAIAAHRGGLWNPRTLIGSGVGDRILGRSLYNGVEIWGRLATERDENFKRTRVRRAASECVEIQRPELRIVSADLWAAVAERLERERKKASRKPHVPPVPPPLLGGLVRCGCGRAMAYGGRPGTRERLMCSSPTVGTADHPKCVRSADVERRVVDILRDDAKSRAATTDTDESLGSDRDKVASRLRRRIRKLEERLASVFDAGPEPMRSAAIADRQRRRQALLTRLDEQLLGLTLPVGAPDTGTAFEGRLRTLIGPFPIRCMDAEDIAFREHLRSRIRAIVVTPSGRGQGYDLRVELLYGRNDPWTADAETKVFETRVPGAGIGFAADLDLMRHLTVAAERGAFELDDATWAAVEPILEPLSGIRIGTRRLAHAALFLALTGMPRRRAPICFGPVETLGEQLRRMGSTGVWARLVGRLVDLGWPHADRLNPDHYDLAPPSKRAVGLVRQAGAVAVLRELAERRTGSATNRKLGVRFGKLQQASRDCGAGNVKKKGFIRAANRGSSRDNPPPR